jgi:Fe-S-cluster containining protein
MGTVHEIKEQKSTYEFIVRNRYTGELSEVRVDEDKRDLFYDSRTAGVLPEACPFFRLDAKSEAGYCTVHLTWPEICRDFGCWKFLIMDREGKVSGRIFPPRMLISEDPGLKLFWETHITQIRGDDNRIWDTEIVAALTNAGYRIIR